MAEDQRPKIHIDDDWKTEAQREKQRLAEEVDRAPGVAAPGQPSFADLVNLIVMQATVGLGGVQGPGGQQIPPNLEMAKYHIDLLEVLERKTAGNLDDEEKRLLSTVLYNLRMGYVNAVNRPSGQGASR